jgi:peroxiredoxin
LDDHFEGEGFTILTVNVLEEKDAVKKFMKKNGYPLKVLLDSDGQVSWIYDVRQHPKKVLIDKRGKVIGLASGYREWDTEEAKSLFLSLIQSKE